MSGQPVQLVTQIDSFDMLKAQNELFFTYVGPRNGSLWNIYYSVAEHFQPYAYFYTTSQELADAHFDIDTVPVVLVFKESSHYYFPRKFRRIIDLSKHCNIIHTYIFFFSLVSSDFHLVDEVFLNDTLFKWVNEERFMAFPKVTRSNIYQISQTQKFLVLAVVEENKLSEIASHEMEFRNTVEGIIRQKYDKYHKRFQFGWIGTPDIAHSIVMDTLATPHLIVLNTSTYEHYIPDDEPRKLTAGAIELFLQNIHHEKVRVRLSKCLSIIG